MSNARLSLENIQKLIMQASFRGDSKCEMKRLYIQRNIIGCSASDYIYRITPLQYFIEDLRNARITLSNISSSTFGDCYENPLRDHEVIIDGEPCTFGFLENYFASCWTTDPMDSDWRWKNFANSSVGIRLETSVGSLMKELMNLKDEHFMLNYWAVKVGYVPFEEIDALYGYSDYSLFLDSSGIETLRLVTTLVDNLSEEEEVRVLYTSQTNPNEYLRKNVIHFGDRCSLPFDWSNVLTNVCFSSDVTDWQRSDLEEAMRQNGITCPVTVRDRIAR